MNVNCLFYPSQSCHFGEMTQVHSVLFTSSYYTGSLIRSDLICVQKVDGSINKIFQGSPIYSQTYHHGEEFRSRIEHYFARLLDDWPINDDWHYELVDNALNSRPYNLLFTSQCGRSAFIYVSFSEVISWFDLLKVSVVLRRLHLYTTPILLPSI